MKNIKGKIPNGYNIDHLCHNVDKTCMGGNLCKHRRCVNPEHLEAVTAKVNVRRGRRAKLTQEEVDEIRRIYKEGGITQTKLGKIYDVDQTHINKLLHNRGWS